MLPVQPTIPALAPAAALATAAVAPEAAYPRPLVVIVEGVRGDDGVVHVDLCSADTFLSDRCRVTRTVRARDGVVSLTFSDVPSGEYAIQAYHDRDEDGQVSRNVLGIPTEELGFSRAPPMGLHGPTFVRAAFTHGAAPQAVTIRLRRFW